MITFTKAKLTLLHRMSLQTPGGDFSVKNDEVMDRILDEAYNSGKYRSREEVAAYLGFSIIYERPFAIENTGAGMYIMLAFLEVNGVRMNPEPAEVVEIAHSAANGAADYEKFLSWILEKEYR